MLGWWLIGVALAGEPTGAPGQLEVAGQVEGLALSVDESVLVGHDRDNQTLVMVTVDDWRVRTASPCGVRGAAPVTFEPGELWIYLACSDGRLVVMHWDGLALTESPDHHVEVGTSLDGVWVEPVDYWLVARSENEVHLYDLLTGDIDPTPYPVPLLFSGFVDAAVVGPRLLVAHGADNVSEVSIEHGAVVGNAMPSGISVVDVAPSVRGGVYGVDPAGWLAEYLIGENRYTILRGDLDGASAVGASHASGDEWLVVAFDDDARTLPLSGGVLTGEPSPAFDLPLPVHDIVAGTEGYAFGAAQGAVVVMTARPWVQVLEVSPTQAASGDVVELRFEVDVAGSWEVSLGGDRHGGGLALTSGSIDGPGEVAAQVQVDDGWREGDNLLVVRHTSPQLLTGHGGATVLVDNPPGEVMLTDANVGFADQALVLSFAGLPDEDLSHYDVYVTATPFDRADWPEGGPDFDGPDALDAPIRVPGEAGEPVSVVIAPLTNDHTYYIAVRATDAGGLEGPMSNVIQGRPRATAAASVRAGEPGGCACDAGGGGAFGAALVGLLAFARRRRAVAAAGAGALLFAAPAQAEERTRTGNFEVRAGPIFFEDDNLQAVYGLRGNKLLQIEVGPQLFRVLELDLGIGYLREQGYTVDAAGEASAQEAWLTLLPLSAGLTGRLQIWDGQPLVPHARVGLDWIPWREAWDVGLEQPEFIAGLKRGWHYAFGGGLLLNIFEPRRASLLETQTGIKETYLVAEWREQQVGDGQGLSFTASAFTIGLKLDF